MNDNSKPLRTMHVPQQSKKIIKCCFPYKEYLNLENKPHIVGGCAQAPNTIHNALPINTTTPSSPRPPGRALFPFSRKKRTSSSCPSLPLRAPLTISPPLRRPPISPKFQYSREYRPPSRNRSLRSPPPTLRLAGAGAESIIRYFHCYR